MAVSLLDPIVKVIKDVFSEAGIKIRQTSGTRTSAEQQELYGQAESNKYPVAPPGTSQHEFGLAVDLVTDPAEYQSVLGEVWNALGLYWTPSDKVHFATFDASTWTSILLFLQYGNIERPPQASMQSLQAYPSVYAQQYSAASPFDLLGTPYEPSSQQYQGGQYSGQWASYADRSTYPVSIPEGTIQYVNPQQFQQSPQYQIPTLPAAEEYYPSPAASAPAPSAVEKPAQPLIVSNPPVLQSYQRRLLRRGGTELETLLG